MRLVQVAGGGAAVPLALIGADPELAAEVQYQLHLAGVLDPPSDGLFGPVSHWALGEFLAHWGLAGAQVLDREVASALLQGELAFAMAARANFAGDIVRAMQGAGYWLSRHPHTYNIVYIERMGLDGTPPCGQPGEFADVRLLLRIASGGRPEILGAWDATLAPGRSHDGVAAVDAAGGLRLARGQYKAWCIGQHAGATPHEALVQVEPVKAHREGEPHACFTGMFGLDQHWGHDIDEVGCASAGCLASRTRSGHREFMSMLRADPRHGVCKGYRFMTTVLSAEEVGAGYP